MIYRAPWICVAVALCACTEETVSVGDDGRGGMAGMPNGGEGGEPLGGMGGDGGSDEGGGGSGGDGGSNIPPCVDPGPLALSPTPPAVLSATGLFEDIAMDVISSDAKPYTPRYSLWSDGSTKRRWIYLPPTCVIDTTDMDDWSFPVGTRAWKEFSLGGQRIETRVVHRYGEGPTDFWYASYAWDAGQTEATRVPMGAVDALGTTHDIPSETQCIQCHAPTAAVYLGFEALQLSHAGPGVTMASLSAEGALSTPAPNGFEMVGVSAIEQDALGYIHANCKSCHNPSQVPLLPVSFKVRVTDSSLQDTDIFNGCVGENTLATFGPNLDTCITPGYPSESVLRFRMSQRQVNVQMPPFATDDADVDGLAAVDAWISALP